MNPEQLAYWYWLNDVKGIGPIISRKLLSRFHSPEKVFSADKNVIINETKVRPNILDNLEKSKSSFAKYLTLAERQTKIAEALHGYILTSIDAPYSEIYNNCQEEAALPSIVHAIGDLGCLKLRKFAIVGTRNPTIEGKERANNLARSLVANNFCIVSGMALGIDTQGHKGALDAGGKTIAVLGSGADVCYPADNTLLYTEIRQKGLIMSEFPFGVRTTGENLRQRNRTVVSLSEGVAIAECPLTSGTMIAARFVVQQKKPLFAFDTCIPNNSGGQWLIKKSLGIGLKDFSAQEVLASLADHKQNRYVNVDKVFEEIWPKHKTPKAQSVAPDKKLKTSKATSSPDTSFSTNTSFIQSSLPFTDTKSNNPVSPKKELTVKVKDTVSHAIFGTGQITKITETRGDYQLTIQFSKRNVRTLSWQFGNLTRIQ